MAQRSVPLKAAGVIADGARGEVWRAVALQAHLLGKPPRPVRTRSSSAGARQESQVHSGLSQPSRSAPSASGFRHAELDYDEKIRRHQASLSLAQRMGLVAEPAQPLTSMQWEVVKHRSDTREDSEVPCSICLEDFRMRPQVILSCSHVFHGECLRSFERFAGKRQCPLCRCPYFDATIHHSGLMVWRKKCASRIQRAWRGYLSRKELFNELRLPSVRKEAPTLHRRFCGKALQVLGGKLEKACEDHEDALDKFLEELDGSVAKSSAAIRDGLCGFEQLHGGIQPPPDGSQAEVISAVKGLLEGLAICARTFRCFVTVGVLRREGQSNGHGHQHGELPAVVEKKLTARFVFNLAIWQIDKAIEWNYYPAHMYSIVAALCPLNHSMSSKSTSAQFVGSTMSGVHGTVRQSR
ncbi:unnamed protein product [Durusdinium trenchii]|uniref:Uncharacterized protein n=2 Tax=Durusdinium trenchii TaxID=1381693 RepID=A0ABP0QD74_9DINO